MLYSIIVYSPKLWSPIWDWRSPIFSHISRSFSRMCDTSTYMACKCAYINTTMRTRESTQHTRGVGPKSAQQWANASCLLAYRLAAIINNIYSSLFNIIVLYSKLRAHKHKLNIEYIKLVQSTWANGCIHVTRFVYINVFNLMKSLYARCVFVC